MSDWVGRQIKQYRVDARLGQGGMGVVYRAWDTRLSRPVALKLMHEHLGREAAFRQRFWKEAQVAAGLDHAGIVHVHDFGAQGEILFLVMAYVPGPSLRQAWAQARDQGALIELRDSLTVLAQVADALDHAHRQGVVHRDIKPDNILLRPGPDGAAGEAPVQALLTDFGLARLLEGDDSTRSGALLGTLSYMAPEHVLGEPMDGRADLYGLGVILYELATGQLPFAIKTPTEAVLKHLQETPPPPEAVRPDLAPHLAVLIARSIARRPERRFQTGAALARALREAAQSPVGQALASPADAVTVSLSQTVALSLPEAATQVSLESPLPAAPAPEAWLFLRRQSGAEERLHVTGPSISVGRAPDNDLVLDETGVSRHHARVEWEAGVGVVRDLGSTNGTVLAGRHIVPHQPVTWRAGETLQFGPCLLQWQPEAATGPAPWRPVPVTAAPAARGRLVPTWLWVILALLLVSALASGALLVAFAGQRGAMATATAQTASGGAVPVGTQWPVAAAGTATGEAAVALATLTADARATAEAADVDGDGLTAAEERVAGTDPARADTDGDGLLDGAEVRDHRSNPLLADSDGDGLPDGVEVAQGRSPVVAETPTPTATATAMPPRPTATPTATRPRPSATPTATASPAPSPTPTATDSGPSVGSWRLPLRVRAGEMSYWLRPMATGALRVTLSWTGAPGGLQASLLNPSGAAVVTASGPPPLQLATEIGGGDGAPDGGWQLVFGSAAGEEADVDVTIALPLSGGMALIADRAALKPGRGAQTAVVWQARAGVIQARASWTGETPEGLTLRVRAPGGPVLAVADGLPPLAISRPMDAPADPAGAAWLVSIAGEGAVDATGLLDLAFP